jgi:hypothetical protein
MNLRQSSADPHPDAGEGGNPAQSSAPLKQAPSSKWILYRGELPRGDAPGLVGTGERQGRRTSLRLALPTALAFGWMPRLFRSGPQKKVKVGNLRENSPQARHRAKQIKEER